VFVFKCSVYLLAFNDLYLLSGGMNCAVHELTRSGYKCFCWNISRKKYVGVKGVDWMMVCGVKLLGIRSIGGCVRTYILVYTE
jgi:hypothetical protein